MCWYKIESKNILFSLQKYFIVLLTMFTFSQQIVGGNISEEIKEEFKKIKQNQICSCCINFQDSDMQFVIALSQTNKELNRTNEELKKTNEEQEGKYVALFQEFEGMNNELNNLEDQYKKNEAKLIEKEKIINSYNEERTQILNVNKKLNVQLEETCNKLKKLNEKYEEFKKKHKGNAKIIDKYKKEIEEYKNKINQIVFENNNLNEQLKNFSSNVNDVDLMKFQQKADENKSREILNIFNDKTPGQPLTDTGIFYLPFQFLGDKEENSIKSNHNYKESGFKNKSIIENTSNYKDSKDGISLGNNYNNINFKKQSGNIHLKNFNKIPNNKNSNNTGNEVNNIYKNERIRVIFKRKISSNSSLISEETEESKEDIKIRNNKFYLDANSAFPGGYGVLTLGNLNKIIFSRYSVEKRIEYPTVNIDTLKKLYLINEGATWIRKEEVKNNEKEKNKNEVKNKNKKETKEKNKKETKEENNKEVKNKNKEENKEENNYIIKTQESFTGRKDSSVKFSSKCFYESNKNISIECSKVKNMDIDDNTMKKINLNYKDYIDFVNIDEYLAKDEDNKKKYFLLKLDLKDPECIALLQQVGKGNYGVVKKALIFENNRYVPKAIKFTCANSEYENATKENIEKEIFAGRVARLVDPDNIAYVQNYMKIDKFISRRNNTEEEKIYLSEVWDEYLSKERYEKFQEDKQNIKKCFENNVFKGNKKISGPLYIMIMDLIDGDDLFKNREKIDINALGDILSKVLINCSSKVALNDIKAKNIIFNKKENKFSIIDIQTLEKTTSDLRDSLGTPEYWPFFKTLNINFEELKNVGEDNLLNIYCNTIDNNFVDTYAACMTMYFTKFHTFTAAGLLTLLLKWMVLEKENEEKKGWKKIPLNEKIDFLQKYEGYYKKYINFVSGDKEHISNNLEKSFFNYDKDDYDDNEINEINTKGDDYSDIRFFFENIDDRNLNNDQKNKLADLLKEVIFFENKSNIFYLLDKIEKQIQLSNGMELDNNKYNQILNFYKGRVNKDFENFAELSKENCRYDDFIKYILCFGSCLNYNKVQNISDTDKFLENIELKENFEEKEEKFFIEENNIGKTINDLVSGFNQKFINDLLKFFPLDKYYNIPKNCINDKQMLEYSLKKLFTDLKEEGALNKKMKVFYLLHLFEKNNALHVPRNLIKSFSLIKDKKEEIKIK